MRQTTREINGRTIGLRVLGDGEPIVLLHGIGRSLSDWSLVQPRLAKRFTTYALDLEGFGRTRADAPEISLASIATNARDTLRTLGETRPIHLIGHSLGGAVAMQMVADDPEGVASLTLVDSAGFGEDASLALRLLTVPGLGETLLRLHLASRVALPLLFRDHRRVSPYLARETRTVVSRGQAVEPYIALVRSLGSWGGIFEQWRATLTTAIAATDVPVMVVWGDRDHVLSPRHFDNARRMLPAARAELLRGVGHAPQIDDPIGFVRLISDFVSAADRQNAR